jgi:hypothetical protein
MTSSPRPHMAVPGCCALGLIVLLGRPDGVCAQAPPHVHAQAWKDFAASLPLRVQDFNGACCQRGAKPPPWGPGNTPPLCRRPAKTCSLRCAHSLYVLTDAPPGGTHQHQLTPPSPPQPPVDAPSNGDNVETENGDAIGVVESQATVGTGNPSLPAPALSLKLHDAR